jgi:hypothetical protein
MAMSKKDGSKAGTAKSKTSCNRSSKKETYQKGLAGNQRRGGSTLPRRPI